MGLDIYLERFTKVNLDTNKIYKQEELETYSTMTVDDAEDRLPQELIENFTSKVDVEYTIWDWNLLYNVFKEKYPEIYTDNKRPKNLIFHNTGASYKEDNQSYIWRDYENDTMIELIGKTDDDFAHITSTQIIPTYVYKTEEVDYQRKGLTEYGWELLPENCSYCTDYQVVSDLTKEGLSDTFLDNWVDGETALLAWW